MPRYVLSLFLLLLPLSLFAAGHEVSTVRYAPSDSYSGSPSLASNDNRFLMLWSMDAHIYGALSDPASETQPPAFPSVPFASASPLQVTAAGSGYLAIWNRYGVPPSLGTLNSEGVLEHLTQLVVSTLSSPRMAFNGSHILIVDQLPTSTSTPNPTSVSVYDLSGSLVRRFPLPVFGAYAVTAAGNDFAVVTAGPSGINEWRVANDGTILSTLQIAPPANDHLSIYYIDVASKNGRIAIAWAQFEAGSLSGVLIQPNGTITKMALVDGGLPRVSGLALLPVDIGFVVTWNVAPPSPDGPTLFALRLDQDGSLLDARPVSLGNAFFGAAASSGRAIELALFNSPQAPPSTLIVTVDANGFSPRAATTPVTAVRQSLPVVTGNGSGFTTAWLEQSEGFRGIVAARSDHESNPLDGSGITFGSDAFSAPAMAHGSSQSLVAWSTNNSVVAARLAQSGEVLDTTPIAIAKPLYANSVAAAWNGSRYFVVWPDGIHLVGAFVGPDGVATTPRPLGNQTTALTYDSGLDMAWDGKEFVLVFGEVSYSGNVCGECVLTPDHVRVMRVSAAGDAVDVMPVRIPGVHLRAHVASSGTESLIALDSASDTSTMIAGEEFGYLKLGPEVPLFHWFSSAGSDVTWNGSTYIVGWRYTPSPANTGWFGARMVSRSGVPLQSFVTPGAGPPDLTWSSVPSVATNDASETGFVISEMAPPSYVARARLYLMSELAPMPAPPPAPRNVISDFGGGTTLIQWQSDGAEGFLLESSFDFGKSWYPFAVTGDVRGTTLLSVKPGNLIRVSAFGPGGLSAGTITSIGSQQRRHASH